MKNFVALAAFAAGTNALVGRGDGCCFHITASGDVSGGLGQLGDGQVRVGDNSLSPSQLCINSNGAITDGNGRGCIVTSDTTQFQCDEGATATTGFSVSSSGKLEYDGSSDFVACETGQNNGRNIYIKESDSVTQCKKVELNADKCSGNGSGAGGSSSSVAPSSVPVAPSSSIPLVSSSAVPTGQTSSGIPGIPGSGASSSMPVPSNTGQPGSGSGPSVSAPGSTAPLPGSPVTVVSTVTVNDCSCSSTGVPGGPAPGGSSGVPGVPASSGSAHPSGPPGGAQPSGPSGVPQPSGPSGGQPSHSSGMPAPSGTSHPSGPTGGSHTPSVPGGSASASHSSPAMSPKPSTTMSSVPVSSASGSASASASSTRSASRSCPTTLKGSHTSGNYEYPHLIVPVDSSSPDTAAGTSLNGTVSSSVSSIFNFDIPSSDAGKTCSLVFLFPQKADLETSSYSFSGDGKIDFSKLSKVATESTTYNNKPSVSQDLGQITISPGNSYLVSTFSCPAGEAISYEMKEAGSTKLNFFQDYNPSPLGLYITVC